MFDKLFEFLVTFYDYLKFWWVVEQYNQAVLLRFGKFEKVLNPGFHWKYPMTDMVVETTVVPTTMRLQHQSLSTKDEKNIVVQAVIKYQIQDVKKLLLEVYDPVDAIGDMTQAIIKSIIMERTWLECKDTEIDNMVTKKARIEAKKWGIEIMQVTLVDIAIVPSFRLMSSNSIIT